MEKDTFVYSFKIAGVERKQAAALLAETLGEQVNYLGAPNFSYKIGGWTIDRSGLISSPEILIAEPEVLRRVINSLVLAGTTFEGEAALRLTMDGHNGVTLRNLVNLIWSKQVLLQKALGLTKEIIPAHFIQIVNSVPLDSVDDFASLIDNSHLHTGDILFDFSNSFLEFKFFNSTLNVDEVLAYLKLCLRLSQQAIQQKFTSVKQKETENDKYSMRCWLLRLGFLGDAYKMERRVLLAKLDGHVAFRTADALKEANEKRKKSSRG